jgi:hypothetical protein
MYFETEDGWRFSSEIEAKNHEEYLKRQKEKNKLEEKQIQRLAGRMPLNYDGVSFENGRFIWFKVNDSKEMTEIKNAFLCVDVQVPINGINYPEVICIQENKHSAWVYYLSEIKKNTERFWRRVGYDVKFKKREE